MDAEVSSPDFSESKGDLQRIAEKFCCPIETVRALYEKILAENASLTPNPDLHRRCGAALAIKETREALRALANERDRSRS